VANIINEVDFSFLQNLNEQYKEYCTELAAGSVDLWWVPVPDISVTKLYERYSSILSENEQQRFLTQRLPKGQLQFLLTRIVLRHLFSVYHDGYHPGYWRFGKSETGRPQVDRAQSSLEFNLTHTGNILLIAVANSGSPGVDAERLGRFVDVSAIASRYFSSTEAQQMLEAAPELKNELFLRMWTLKEAAVKATGLGLSRALKRFSFSSPMTAHFAYQDSSYTDAQREDVFKFWSATHNDYALAVCLLNSGKDSAEPVGVNSRILVWPTAAEKGYVSALNIDWRRSR
jgi:phosphopantetheine--protein transferase-like protein